MTLFFLYGKISCSPWTISRESFACDVLRLLLPRVCAHFCVVPLLGSPDASLLSWYNVSIYPTDSSPWGTDFCLFTLVLTYYLRPHFLSQLVYTSPPIIPCCLVTKIENYHNNFLLKFFPFHKMSSPLSFHWASFFCPL